MASLQRKGLQARMLSSEEEEKLKRDQALVSDFKQQKLEKEAQKNWDLFYKRNSTNFFKDRHWTTREFEELRSCREQNPSYNTERCKVFQCDLTKDDLLEHVPSESVDVVMLIFVLSAIHPDRMQLVLQNVYKDGEEQTAFAIGRPGFSSSLFHQFALRPQVLKPGKCVLFRDYGLYDHAMLRFKAGSKLGENFYVRQDGTRSYFFTDEFLAQLFTDTGYEEVINEYVFRETVNKKEGLCVPRVFLQSKFRKPPKHPAPTSQGPGPESQVLIFHEVDACAFI
ncbi:tRNA N(3)-methylcytidine methyltransferase METTL6 isoform X3 [Elephas maximus indicus]|uniref:tRNA N(3)-methylcytidine methyltransferase METTL6 isoform X3 n=1 Tax=Elephas maximus indicus TaxID=99487 RepID=UPI0021162574|nr:tRNA N(3)-methylcytidine methyltransferase METTL6 isoform X3 [Elephas maximus indicus]